MRKIISVIYLLCSFTIFNAVSAQVTFTASNPAAECDDASFCVEVSVSNFDSVTSFQHVYDWDTSIIQLISFNDLMPEGFGVAPSMDSTDVGRGPYSWFNSPYTNLANGFVIAELCFAPNNLGNSTIDFLGSNTTLLQVSGLVNGVNTANIPAAYNAGTVTVQDSDNPIITCPSDTTIASNGTNVGNIAPVSTSDNCGIASISFSMENGGMNVGSGMDDASGQFFTLGTTAVTYTTVDETGNNGNCSFNVTLTAAPVNNDSTLQFIPEVNLDCETGAVTIDLMVINFDSITGMQFGVQWDTSVLTYNGATNALPPAASYSPASDSSILFLWFPFSGMPLTLADSSVIFTLNFDLNGTFESPLLNFVSFPGIPIGIGQIQNGVDVSLLDFIFMPEILNVIDNTPPVITNCPTDMTVSNDAGLCSAVVNWTAPTITDNCGIDTVIVSHSSGDVFNVGTTTVTYTATDIGGNTVMCDFNITVTDSEDPMINCPGNVTVDSDAGACENSSVNIGMAIASDNCGIASVSNDAPASFPVGTTTVTWTATDVNGRQNTCTQTITVEDNELPTISCPADIVECPGVAINLGMPVTSDNCGVASVTNDAPANFPLGITFVTHTVTDDNGNVNTCMQRVIIQDNDAPVLTCPGSDAIDAEPGICSAVYNNNLRPMVTDNCDTDVTVTYNVTGATTIMNGMGDATGETFNVGTSTLTYYATDDAGNIDSCSVAIQVNDNQLPVLNCPNNTTIFVPAGTVDTMINGLALMASDNCGIADISFEYSGELTGNGIGDDASITFFPPGTTTITYFATDVNGNLDSCSFDVNVITVTSDLIGCQPDQVEANDTDVCSAVINGIAPTLLVDMSDIASINYTLSGATTGTGTDDASGLSFNVGTTTLEYIATDNFGNMDTCTLDITVNDTQIPDWSNCPLNITESVNIAGTCTANVSWAIPTPSDNCGVVQNIPSHNPGDIFPLGTTTVSYVAIDAAGNIATCSFNVTVEDNTAPTANCPSDITVNAPQGSCEASVSWSPATGMDDCSAVTVNCTHNPGDIFPVGTSTVTCTISDASGNFTNCSFNVVVADNTAPVPVDCPTDITVAPTLTNCEAIVSWTEPSFTDCPPVNVTSTHEPGDTFPLGTTTVIYIAIDPFGNDTTCTFDVIVADTEDPVVMCPADITVNSLAKDCGAFVNWPAPSAMDNCDMNVTIDQNPPIGTFFPVGTTTVTVNATDDSGNVGTCTFSVIVNDVIAPSFECPTQPIIISVDGTVQAGTDPLGLINNTGANDNCDSLIIDYNIPNVSDNCIVQSVNLNDGIAPGGTFPIGTTVIEYIAFDDANNFSICNFGIEVLPLDPVGVAILPSDEVCAGEDVQLVTNVTAPGAIFQWFDPNGDPLSNMANPSISDVTLDDAGTYTVVVTFLSGCTASGSDELIVNPADAVFPSSNSPICTDGDIELSVDVPNGTIDSVIWTGPADFVSNEQNPVITNPTAANSGTYTVTVTYVGGCVASATTDVSFTSLPAPEIDMDCITDICLGSTCLLTGTEYAPTPDFYFWEAVPAENAGLPDDTNNNQISITPTAPGTYIYNYSVELNGCESEQASQVVIVHGAPNAVEDQFTVPFETTQNLFVQANDTFNTNIGVNMSLVSTPANGTVEVNEDGTISYTPNSGFIGIDQFIYEICYDCGPLLCDNTLVTIQVTDDRDCVIPTVITPNKDGLNDELFINCLESGNFPNNEIIIYNQWGDEVFTAAPYQNNWEGTHDGKDLPDGTYYMVFKLDDNAELIKQFITIFR